jgi:hypothetical protein
MIKEKQRCAVIYSEERRLMNILLLSEGRKESVVHDILSRTLHKCAAWVVSEVT